MFIKKKIKICVWSRISKFLPPAQRYDDFKFITSKTAVVLLAGVTISGTPYPRHFTVPFGAEAPRPRPEQSHLLPEACSPDDTDKRRKCQRQTERPLPEPSNILKRFCALYDDKIRYYKKKVSKSRSLFNHLLPYIPILETSDFS